jgi:hypothetical protein
MPGVRCKCNHNQQCPTHSGLVAWLRRSKEYFLFLRMGNGWWLDTPLVAFAWRGSQDSGVLFAVYLLPARWSLIVPEGERFHRWSWRWRMNSVQSGM